MRSNSAIIASICDDLPPLFVDLEPLQADETFTRLHLRTTPFALGEAAPDSPATSGQLTTKRQSALRTAGR